MLSRKDSRIRAISRVIAFSLVLALAIVFSTACTGQSASSEASSSVSSSQAATVDTSGWKTLGDALAAQTESLGSSWNDDYIVTAFKVGDSIVRVVAKIDHSTHEAINKIDWSAANASDQIGKVAGSAPLISAEDITGELISQDELDQLIGKSAQELVDAGWIFDHYFMYGGEQTGASFAKGSFDYSFTLDVSISENDTEDGGASVMSATIVDASFEGISNDAIDPSKVS